MPALVYCCLSFVIGKSSLAAVTVTMNMKQSPLEVKKGIDKEKV